MAKRYSNWILPSLTLLLCCMSITASVAAESDTTEKEWHFKVTPVIWNASVDASFSDENSGGDIPIDPDYSFFTLDNLDSYLSLKAEAEHGRFGLLFDTLRASYQDETTDSPVYFSLATKLGFAELSASYRITDNYKLDIIAGVRRSFLDIDTTLRLLQRPGRVETRSYDWVDPILGLRYQHSFNPKWSAIIRGDFGIFDTGSDETHQLSADMIYQLNTRISFLVGYRYLYLKFREDDLLYDTTLYGLQLGLGIHF